MIDFSSPVLWGIICGLAGIVLGLWMASDGGEETSASLFEIQSRFADAADLPVDKASRGLKWLRGRPEILRRLLTMPPADE